MDILLNEQRLTGANIPNTQFIPLFPLMTFNMYWIITHYLEHTSE